MLERCPSGAVLVAEQVPRSEVGQQPKPDKLAIGVEGGFDAAVTHRVEKDYALVLMPARLRVPLPCAELPQLVLDAIASVQVSGCA